MPLFYGCHVFFGKLSPYSITTRACWRLSVSTTSTISVGVWPHLVVLVQSCHVGYCWQDECGSPGDRRKEERGGLKKHRSLSIFTTSDPSRAGHQTCKSLTWQLKPLQLIPALLTWRLLQCSQWKSMPVVALELILPNTPSSAVQTSQYSGAQERSGQISLKIHH